MNRTKRDQVRNRCAVAESSQREYGWHDGRSESAVQNLHGPCKIRSGGRVKILGNGGVHKGRTVTRSDRGGSKALAVGECA